MFYFKKILFRLLCKSVFALRIFGTCSEKLTELFDFEVLKQLLYSQFTKGLKGTIANLFDTSSLEIASKFSLKIEYFPDGGVYPYCAGVLITERHVLSGKQIKNENNKN